MAFLDVKSMIHTLEAVLKHQQNTRKSKDELHVPFQRQMSLNFVAQYDKLKDRFPTPSGSPTRLRKSN